MLALLMHMKSHYIHAILQCLIDFLHNIKAVLPNHNTPPKDCSLAFRELPLWGRGMLLPFRLTVEVLFHVEHSK